MREFQYGFAVQTNLGLEEAEKKVREALAAEGFGILTEIDVAATLERKLGVRRAPYKILGACNPDLAHRALEADVDIGLLLPCNVVLRASDGGTVVAALEPRVMSRLTENDTVQTVAEEARERLVRALSLL